MEMLMETKEILMLWNMGLTLTIGVVGFFLKEKFNEIQRLNILLNRTREEIAGNNVTQAEIDKVMEHIDSRFNRLEDKINQLMAR
jgi:archaellum component FlaC